MCRTLLGCRCTLGILFALLLAMPPAPIRAQTPDVSPNFARDYQQIQATRKKLKNMIRVDRPIDATLKDCLEFAADNGDLTILVDPGEFQKAGIKDIADKRIQLPIMKEVHVGVFLNRVLAQVQGTIWCRRDYIEIIPRGKAVADRVVEALMEAPPVFYFPR